jgi:hypothetical protein
MRCHFAFENRSHLGEFEAEFKKALARESGAQGVLFDEKTEGQKSRDTVYKQFLAMLEYQAWSSWYKECNGKCVSSWTYCPPSDYCLKPSFVCRDQCLPYFYQQFYEV